MCLSACLCGEFYCRPDGLGKVKFPSIKIILFSFLLLTKTLLRIILEADRSGTYKAVISNYLVGGVTVRNLNINFNLIIT